MSQQELVMLDMQDSIATITINNPPMNPLSRPVLEGIARALDRLEREPDLRVVIFTGAGEKAFVAGADIKEFPTWTAQTAVDNTAYGQRLFQRVESFPAATIAAIGGFALGGGLELALACDIRVASDNAKMGLPEVTLGIIPGYGGTQRLVRAIGPGQAKKLIFTGGMIPAAKALEIGIVQDVVAKDDLRGFVRDMAEKIAANAPIAVRSAKRAIDDERMLTMPHGTATELEAVGCVFASEDKTEGVGAFIEKRKPVFRNQ